MVINNKVYLDYNNNNEDLDHNTEYSADSSTYK